MPKRDYPLTDRTAVVLAGGTASRFGSVGKILPKPLFPISVRHTLLSRTVEWLFLGGCSRIIVSTTPAQYAIVAWHTTRFCELFKPKPPLFFPRIEVFPNDKHADGPIHALASAAAWSGERSVLFCLSDICFLANPFARLTRKHLAKVQTAVFTTKLKSSDELSYGGIATISHSRCTRIYVRPDECANLMQERHRWSGIALLDSHALSELQRFATTTPTAVEEHFINHCIALGHVFDVITVSSFINVNKMQDYRRALRLLSRESDKREEQEP
jgi:NDP-sugar pyrophosphorylase family protein